MQAYPPLVWLVEKGRAVVVRVWNPERLWVHRRAPQRFTGVVAASAVTVGLILTGSPMPKHGPLVVRPNTSPGVSVPMVPVPHKNIAVRNAADNVAKATEITWPAASNATVTLASPSASSVTKAGSAANASASSVKPGSLGPRAQASKSPVWLQAVAGSKGAYTGPSSAQVAVLAHAKSAALGVSGEVFTIAGASAATGQVKVGLDYKGFAQQDGGNFGSRLTLVQLPACALTTPQLAACRKQSPLRSLNQAVAQQVSATVALGGTTAGAPRASTPASSTAAPAMQTLVLAATSSTGTEGAAAGNYAATSLKPSGSWNEGGDSGSYDYTYPISLPGSSSSLTPTVSLSYNSQAVDGQTAATNAQSSWAGDGWGTPDSFIEQTFTTCSDSPEGVTLPSSESTSDECYDGPILTISLNGSSTSLVCNSDETQCTEQADSGDVVTHVTNANNGSKTYNADYWKITQRDGATYYFGLNELPGYASGDKTTNSVDYEPVYSANSGDPCYNSAGFTSSVCTMAYRWHLDYVTNATGQAMSYYYTQTTNKYGEDNGASDVSYIRDSYISEIDYGFGAGGEYGTVPDKVVFTPSSTDRCVQSSCTLLSSSSMTATLAATDDPDVPFDLLCGAPYAETTCTSYAPSFFSTNALATIETYQYSVSSSAYKPVDKYTLTQTEPTTGDTTNSTLWLESVQHEGMDTSAGASTSGISMPSETFVGTELANRVDAATFPALYRYRLTKIVSELGSVTTITYTTPDSCSDAYVTGETAAGAETNTKSCYPVYWTPQGYTSQILDWFNSYAVSQVLVEDATGGSQTQETDYSYGGGAAWHYDDDEVVKAKYRTYGQFRGYSTVTTYVGQTLNQPQTEQTATYYRGMDGDWSIASNSTKSATVTDSLGGVHTDAAALAGNVLESRQYLGSGGPLDNDSITSYWVSGAVQTRTRTGMDDLVAQMTGAAEVYKSQTDTDGGETGVSTVTETDTTYDATTTDDDFGLATYSYTHTVPANTAYDSCTTNQYAPKNTSGNVVGLISYTETDQVACSGFTEGSSPSVPSGFNTLGAPSSVASSKVASATETFYDDTTFSTTFPQATAPTKGLVTMVRQAVSGTPGSFTWQTTKRDTFDAYGRVADSYDANGNETITSYTVNSVGLTTGETVAAPAVSGIAHTSSQTFDPTRNLTLTSTDENGIVTTEKYDALGRLADVWKNGRSSTLSANLEYAYTVSNTGVSGVTTQTLNDAGVYNTSVTIDDSLGRTRQTQSPSPQGGRLINDTIYDSRGTVLEKYTGYYDGSTSPTMALSTAESAQDVQDQDTYIYDGLGRQVEDISADDGATVTTTITAYNGDATTTFPPIAGTVGSTVAPPYDGTVKTTVTDPLGRTSKLIEYTADPTLSIPSNTNTGVFTISGGTPITTTYGYNAAGTQDKTTDNAGNVWSQNFDLLGRETSSTDPDAGTSTMTYDPNGNLLQTKDAEGNYISYTYDALNRKTAEYNAQTSAQVNFGNTGANQVASWIYDNANNVSGVTDAIGQATTATTFSGGNAYVEQGLGWNNFGESLGTQVTIPSAQGTTLGTTWKFTNTYTTTIGLLFSSTYPKGGGLPAETTNPSYATGLDLPSGLGGTLNGYGQGSAYDDYGRLQSDTYGNGTLADEGAVTYTYNLHNGELTDQLVTRAATNTPENVDETHYTYDADGLTTQETDTRQASTATAENQCFTYTPQDQLSQAWTTTAANCAAIPGPGNYSTVGDNLSAASAYDEAWTYNTAGNQATETQYSTSTGTTRTTTDTYNGNAANQPTTLTGTSTTGGTSTSTAYTYTPDGQQKTRTTSTGDQTLTWNNQGELAGVTNTTTNTNSGYIYDSAGKLLIETDGSNTTLYLPSEQITVNSSGTVVSSQRYYSLPGGITVVRTGASNYDFEIASDQHGTNTLYLNYTAQTPTWRQQDPYGNTRGNTATWIDNRGFLNDPNDATTALTDIGARWYDPTTSSFISLDPVLETADPTQLGGYDYAGNDPVSASDPTGDMPGSEGYGGGCANPPCNNGNSPNCSGYGPYALGSPCNPYTSDNGGNSGGTSGGSGGSNGGLSGGTKTPSTPKGYHWEQCSEFMSQNGNGCAVGTYYLARNYVPPMPNVDQQLYEAFGFGGAVVVASLTLVVGCNPAADAETDAASCVQAIGELTSGALGAPGQDDPSLYGDPTAEGESVGLASGCPSPGGKSFSPDTNIVTANGKSVPISLLQKGAKIEAHNTATGKDESQTVQAVLVNHDTDLYDLTIATTHGTSVIHTTSNHPFWDDTTNSWVDAGKLHVGDSLHTTLGAAATVIRGTTPKVSIGWMWDLTISNDHDFYVVAGNTPILVHNINEGRLCELTLGPSGPSAGVTAARGDRVMPDEQQLVNEAGDQYGCSTCDATKSGYSDGHWTGDHQPPNKLAPNGPWTLYPQCRVCARQQGGVVNGLNQGWYDFPPEPDPEP